MYNRLDRGPENEVFDASIRNDLGVLARVPLASGFLSGKYKPGVEFVTTDVRSAQDKALIDAKLKLVEEISNSEVPKYVDMAQWAIAWCLQHTAVARAYLDSRPLLTWNRAPKLLNWT